MDFKYIVICVILHLIYGKFGASPINNDDKFDNFANFDILDILSNSVKVNSGWSHDILKGQTKSSNPGSLRIIKVHHGGEHQTLDEYTVSTKSSPICNDSSVTPLNQTSGNNTASFEANCCAIVSPCLDGHDNSTNAYNVKTE